jgi:uncharacterized SAM-binding protein YcdF (DUF218 family)
MPNPSHPAQKALWGVLTRRERWGLSLRGFLAAAVLAGIACLALFLGIYPFLAVTHRVNCNLLVVEGWVHDNAIRAAVDEFKTGSYAGVFSTGGPMQGYGGYTNDYNTSASVGASRLRKAGIPDELLHMVPSRVTDRDRTYHAAVALREWFRQNGMSVHAFNIVTENVHARRTRLLYQEAFGSEVKVGIIAIPSPDFDPARWWRYSEGVRDTIDESIAYIYARFLFHPPASE